MADPANGLLLREALERMGRADLVGGGKQRLIPRWQPATDGGGRSARRKSSAPGGARTSPVTKGRVLARHTGLPPPVTGATPVRPGAWRERG